LRSTPRIVIARHGGTQYRGAHADCSLYQIRLAGQRNNVMVVLDLQRAALDRAQSLRQTWRISDGTLVATNLAMLEKQLVNADQLQLKPKIATQGATGTWNEKRVSVI
jgi:hypothetical protein